MKWTKLEYGKWPEGEIVMRIDLGEGPQYLIGCIDQCDENQDIFFYCNMMPSRTSIDIIYRIGPYYIELNKLEIPE